MPVGVFDDEDDAWEAQTLAAADVIRGTFQAEPKRVMTPMFGRFAADYIEQRRATRAPGTVRNWETYLRTNLRSFAMVPVDQMSVRMIEDWWLRHEHQAVNRRNAFFLLRPVLNAAVRYGIIPSNPCLAIDVGAKPGKDVSTKRPAWTEADFLDVLAHVPEEVSLGHRTHAVKVHYREALVIAFGAHLRIEELVGLNASDWEDPILHITKQGPDGRKTKTDYERHIGLLDPAPEALREYLRTNPRTGNAPMFTGPRGGRLPDATLRKAWNKAVAASGRENFHLQDIRSVGLTVCAEMGMPMDKIMERAGHRSERMSLRYIRSAGDRGLDAINLVNERRARLG